MDLGSLLFVLVIFLAVGSLHVVGLCKTFKKMCGRSWVPLIPIYGTYVLNVEIQHRNPGFVLISILALINIVTHEVMDTNLMIYWLIIVIDFGYNILLLNGVSRGFGKSKWFTLGLIFLPFIFFPILGFSKDEFFDKSIFEEKKLD